MTFASFVTEMRIASIKCAPSKVMCPQACLPCLEDYRTGLSHSIFWVFWNGQQDYLNCLSESVNTYKKLVQNRLSPLKNCETISQEKKMKQSLGSETVFLFTPVNDIKLYRDMILFEKCFRATSIMHCFSRSKPWQWPSLQRTAELWRIKQMKSDWWFIYVRNRKTYPLDYWWWMMKINYLKLHFDIVCWTLRTCP